MYDAEKKSPGSQATQDALAVLEGIALFEGPEHEVFVRLALHEDRIYVDLGNPDWNCPFFYQMKYILSIW